MATPLRTGLVLSVAILLGGSTMAATNIDSLLVNGDINPLLYNPKTVEGIAPGYNNGNLVTVIDDVNGVAAFRVADGIVMRNPEGPLFHTDWSRAYVTTVDSDFATTTYDWVATFTYTPGTANLGNGSGDQMYFGIGSGEYSTYYYLPGTAVNIVIESKATGTSAFVDHRPNNNHINLTPLTNGVAGWGNGSTGTIVPRITPGLVEIKKIGDELTFSWDSNQSGTFDATFTIDLTDTQFKFLLEDGNSHLFFGGAWNSMSFDSMSVRIIPEPAAMTLLALGGLAMIRRRHR